MVKQKAQNKAASKIQGLRRGQLGRRQVQAERDAKLMVRRNAEEERQRQKAAARGRLKDVEEQERREQAQAATKIQNMRRGQIGRRQVGQMKAQKTDANRRAVEERRQQRLQEKEEQRQQNQAATKIQSQRRSQLAQRQYGHRLQENGQAAYLEEYPDDGLLHAAGLPGDEQELLILEEKLQDYVQEMSAELEYLAAERMARAALGPNAVRSNRAYEYLDDEPRPRSPLGSPGLSAWQWPSSPSRGSSKLGTPNGVGSRTAGTSAG